MSKFAQSAATAAVVTFLSVSGVSTPEAAAVTIYDDFVLNPTISFFVDPSNYIKSVWWDHNLTPQNPDNVVANLKNAFGATVDWDYVTGSGECGTGAVTCSGATKSGSIDLGDLAAIVFGVHIGRGYYAFMFEKPISMFSVAGMPRGVSNIHAFSTTVIPLPPGLLLFLSGLAGIGFLGRYKAKQARHCRSLTH